MESDLLTVLYGWMVSQDRCRPAETQLFVSIFAGKRVGAPAWQSESFGGEAQWGFAHYFHSVLQIRLYKVQMRSFHTEGLLIRIVSVPHIFKMVMYKSASSHSNVIRAGSSHSHPHYGY